MGLFATKPTLEADNQPSSAAPSDWGTNGEFFQDKGTKSKRMESNDNQTSGQANNVPFSEYGGVPVASEGESGENQKNKYLPLVALVSLIIVGAGLYATDMINLDMFTSSGEKTEVLVAEPETIVESTEKNVIPLIATNTPAVVGQVPSGIPANANPTPLQGESNPVAAALEATETDDLTLQETPIAEAQISSPKVTGPKTVEKGWISLAQIEKWKSNGSYDPEIMKQYLAHKKAWVRLAAFDLALDKKAITDLESQAIGQELRDNFRHGLIKRYLLRIKNSNPARYNVMMATIFPAPAAAASNAALAPQESTPVIETDSADGEALNGETPDAGAADTGAADSGATNATPVLDSITE